LTDELLDDVSEATVLDDEFTELDELAELAVDELLDDELDDDDSMSSPVSRLYCLLRPPATAISRNTLSFGANRRLFQNSRWTSLVESGPRMSSQLVAPWRLPSINLIVFLFC
jgi:hypothetical protein